MEQWWKSKAEFDTVFQACFPHRFKRDKDIDISKVQFDIKVTENALRILKIWYMKNKDLIFQSTYDWIKSLLAYKISLIESSHYKKYQNHADQEQLKDRLSIGLVRIVNLVLDPKKVNILNERKLSMREAADRISFPLRAISQRNDICHTQRTPWLRELTNSYAEIYKWLYFYKWLPKAIEIDQEYYVYSLLDFENLKRTIKNLEEKYLKPNSVWKKHMIRIFDNFLKSILNKISIQITDTEGLTAIFEDWDFDISKTPSSISEWIKCKLSIKNDIIKMIEKLKILINVSRFEQTLQTTILKCLHWLIVESVLISKNLSNKEILNSENFKYQAKCSTLFFLLDTENCLKIDTKSKTSMTWLAKINYIKQDSLIACIMIDKLPKDVKILCQSLQVQYFDVKYHNLSPKFDKVPISFIDQSNDDKGEDHINYLGELIEKFEDKKESRENDSEEICQSDNLVSDENSDNNSYESKFSSDDEPCGTYRILTLDEALHPEKYSLW